MGGRRVWAGGQAGAHARVGCVRACVHTRVHYLLRWGGHAASAPPSPSPPWRPSEGASRGVAVGGAHSTFGSPNALAHRLRPRPRPQELLADDSVPVGDLIARLGWEAEARKHLTEEEQSQLVPQRDAALMRGFVDAVMSRVKLVSGGVGGGWGWGGGGCGVCV